MWVGGVQINGLVHEITEENEMEPSLSSKLIFKLHPWLGHCLNSHQF